MVKHWSTMQKCITLSSGEAELGGVVKGVAEGLGAQALAADMGLDLALSVHADSSSAIGICRRNGIGRVRHLAVGQLWVSGPFEGRCVCIVQGLGRAQPSRLVYKAFGPASDGPPTRADWSHPRAWPGRDCTSGNRRGWAHTLPRLTAVGLFLNASCKTSERNTESTNSRPAVFSVCTNSFVSFIEHFSRGVFAEPTLAKGRLSGRRRSVRK